MRGTVIMVSYDEASAIGPVLAEVEEAASVLGRSGIDIEVLLVDDESPDGTATVAKTVAQELGLRLNIINGRRAGPGKAFLRGFEAALGTDPPDFIVTLDSDGQHDARQIPDLVRAYLARSSGMTIGSRWTRGGTSPGTPPGRAVLSILGNLLIRRVTGLRGVRDATTSFRVIDPEAVALFKPDGLKVDGYGFFSAFAVVTQAYGFSIDEVPITFRPRYSGISKLNFHNMTEFLVNLFRIRDHARQIRREMLKSQTEWAPRSNRFQGQARSNTQYGAMAELKALADADRFFDWVVSAIRPGLGIDILEVGAGIGTVTSRLAAHHPEAKVLAIEPAAEPFASLEIVAGSHPRIEARQVTSAGLIAGEAPSFDSIVYVNVLEHIKDDQEELRRVKELLRPGGALCIFVPAAPGAYGSMDYISGHYRRYRKPDLAAVIEGAGYSIESLTYFDVVGLLPYWLMYRVLDVRRLGRGSAAVFDRLLVPVSRSVQRLQPNPRFGKNLVAIARVPKIEPSTDSPNSPVPPGR